MTIEADDLAIYFGNDYFINDYITIKQPIIKDIIQFGEKDFFSTIHTITAIPSSMKSQLWDMGIDWTEIEDFELFMMLTPTLTVNRTSIFFGDLDFSALKPYKNNQNDEIVLADKETGIVIDKLIYLRIVSYFRKAYGIMSKVEKPANKRTKQVLIDEDRRKIQENKDKPFKSFLLPIISVVKVKQAYTRDYVKNMGYVELINDLKRIQVMYNADHLLSGMYMGNIDVKKINKRELDWLRELD